MPEGERRSVRRTTPHNKLIGKTSAQPIAETNEGANAQRPRRVVCQSRSHFCLLWGRNNPKPKTNQPEKDQSTRSADGKHRILTRCRTLVRKSWHRTCSRLTISDGSRWPVRFDFDCELNGWLPFAAPSCSLMKCPQILQNPGPS
jgi:hypothetical protein